MTKKMKLPLEAEDFFVLLNGVVQLGRFVIRTCSKPEIVLILADANCQGRNSGDVHNVMNHGYVQYGPSVPTA